MIRVLVLDDDDHDQKFCMDNGEIFYQSEFLCVVCPAHDEDYKFIEAYLPDVLEVYKLGNLSFENHEEEQENFIDNLFDNVMRPDDDDVYIDCFEVLWELAKKC